MSNVVCGFELEMLIPDNADCGDNTRSNVRLRKSISKFTQTDVKKLKWVKWESEWFEGPTDKQLDALHKHTNDYDADYFCAEIITAPLPLDIALRNLEMLFKWMDHIGAITNRGCGLHVNLSFTDSRKTDKVDYFKLHTASKITSILKQFKRENNHYCLSIEHKEMTLGRFDIGNLLDYAIHKKLGLSGERREANMHKVITTLKKPGAMDELCNTMIKNVISHSYDKDSAIVPKKFKGKNYYEFRAIGNTNYHKRLPAINSSINKMVAGLHSAIK